MSEFVVYILYSPSSGKTYTGMTSDLITRFHFHNSRSNKGFTLRYRPWIVAHVEFFQNKSEALQREKILKSGTGRDWVREKIIPLFASFYPVG
jgi:putative endonuclease